MLREQMLEKLLEDMKYHYTVEGQPVECRTVNGWIDVEDRIKEILAVPNA